MNQYEEIKPIIQVSERRKMTVGELKQALQEYPDDRTVHISISREMRSFMEIKDITSIVEMDTNKMHPVLNLDTIKIFDN